MQNAGQASGKNSYRVALLLVVGLASIANAVKEVNQLRAVTLQTRNFVAQLKDVFVPATEPTIISVETCQNRTISPPPPPLPAVVPAPPAPVVEAEVNEIEVPEVAPLPPAPPAAVSPAAPRVREVPQPRRVRLARDPAEVRVFVSADDFAKSIKDTFASDQSFKALKAKNRRYIYLTPEGHDVILKTLNRSINLRSAS